MSEQDNGGGGFFSGLVIGGLIGSAIGLLLAPRAGEETVRMVKEKSTELRAKGQEMLNEETGALREVAGEFQEILKEAVDEAREVLKEALKEGRQASAPATEDLQSRFQEAREGNT